MTSFLRNAWYLAAFADEVGYAPLARTLLNEPVVLFRNAEGVVAALEDRCCHRGAPLSMGEVTDKGLMCGYHGLVFDAHGACIDIPGQSQIPARAKVRSYPVVERDEFVWIWMGDPGKAAPEEIVAYPHLAAAKDWPRAHARMHVSGNYTLLMDNLMDLTHLSYLHKTSIGGVAHDHAHAQMETVKTPNGVKFQRLIADTRPPPRYIESYGFAGNIDRWEVFEFVAPANILQSSGAAEAGAGVIDRGLREGPHAGLILHVLTPETETSTHYFFSVATSDRGGPDKAVAMLLKVFAEDVHMIESQQMRLNASDPSGLVDIRSDVARVQMARTLKQKIAEEQQSHVAAE